MIELFNIDCMEYMKTQADNAFDLAIVDPPYGLGKKLTNGRGYNRNRFSRVEMAKKNWDIRPDREYFEELRRVSKHQIIWGGNYFIDYLSPSRGVIAWVKREMRNHPNYSQCEIAWSSFDKPAKVIDLYSTNRGRIHPTQKPTQLYSYLYELFAEPGQRIIDTHLGSGSNAIAAHYFGVEFVGCELDEEYFNAAKFRIEQETKQYKII